MIGTNYKGSPLWLTYIGRMLILAGMALVFAGTMAFLASLICKWWFGVDLSGINIYQIKKEDAQMVSALKVFQTLSGGIGVFLIPALLFPRVIQYRLNTMIMYREIPKWWAVLIGIVLVWVSSPLVSFLSQLNLKMGFPASWSEFESSIRAMETQAGELTKIFVFADTPAMLLTNLFVVALVPAICEEFFFRGIVLQYTRYIFDNIWVAVLVSAFVFSAIHGQFYGFLPRFLMGVVLGFAFLQTGNIWVPVTMHFLNNAMAVFMSYYEKDLAQYALFKETYTFDWYWVILSAAATWALSWWLGKLVIRDIMAGFNKK